MLFLSKGRRPVLVSKLKHEPRDDWNHHRTDLANLTGYVEKRWGREMTWQVIDINQASADDLNQTPVLFLSGQQKPNFTPAANQAAAANTSTAAGSCSPSPAATTTASTPVFAS